MTIQATDEPRFRIAHTPAEELLERMSPGEMREHMRALQQITGAALAHLSLAELLPELLRRIRVLLAVDSATVLLCAEGGQTLVVRASVGLEEEVERQVEVPVGEGIAGAVAARRQAVIVDEVARFETVSPILRRLASLMLAPLIAEGDLLGVMHVGTLAKRSFSEMELYLLQVVADRVALAVKNALLYDRAQEELRERERAEGARSESEARFRVYAESASDAIFAIDAESTILYANPATERIFGYRPEELIGEPMTMLIPERMRAAHRRGVEHYVGTGERQIPWSGVQLPGIHRDGHEVLLEISFGEYVRDGEPFFTGIARDITERVLQQQQLEELAAELEATVDELKVRSEQAEAANEAKTNFMATMSHELRTPLTAVLGYAELLQMGIPTPLAPQAQEQVQRIEQAARHQLGLIEEILTFSRLQAGKEEVDPSPVDLAELSREAVSFIEPLAQKKGLPVHFHPPDSPLVLTTDRAKTKQILANLLSNAVKFTREGEIRVRVRSRGTEAVVAVTDTGLGIDPGDLPKIFDPFWQVQQGSTREAGGTGLGLTVSHRIAQLLGGRITVESAPGQGSTFALHLPRRA